MKSTDDLIFKSSYLLRILKGDYNPFTPNVFRLNDQLIEFRRRNWYLISVDTQTFHFENVVGIDVDKHLLGASIKIASIGTDRIIVHGFSKSIADNLKESCLEYIKKNSARGRDEQFADAISKAIHKTSDNTMSAADEINKLKALLDEGMITKVEFEYQKKKILG